ncbi:MAG: hypothetical protein IKO72_12415 [Kiritimatiellae bacterium]|nr:hypothetical protein [Kiritimatiellia bacterium]
MASENETLADIVAWIRKVAQSYRNTPISKGITTIEGLVVCDAIEGIADRLEAAWKREKEAWKTLHEVSVQMLEQTRAEADRRVEEAVGQYGRESRHRHTTGRTAQN